jgi:probable HAF family extracellular repeat protein
VVPPLLPYTQGSMQDLGTLGGPFSAAFDVNDAGEIAGVSAIGDVEHGFVVGKDGVMRDVGTLP